MDDIKATNRETRRSIKWRSILVSAILLGPAQSSQILAFEIVCGPEIKEEIAAALNAVAEANDSVQLAVQKELYNQYAYCVQDTPLPSNEFLIATQQCGASVPYLGSLYYEEMSCCGYDPQRRQFACPVTIKQDFGFGNPPLPGSREYVYHCVEDSSGNLVPVGVDSVHLADEMHGYKPTIWQFAVIANANENLHTLYPMDGQTRRARSILSWGFEPNSCDFKPIWGNVLEYGIRLDQ